MSDAASAYKYSDSLLITNALRDALHPTELDISSYSIQIQDGNVQMQTAAMPLMCSRVETIKFLGMKVHDTPDDPSIPEPGS